MKEGIIGFLKKISISFEGSTCISLLEDEEFPETAKVFNVPVFQGKVLVTVKVTLKFLGIPYLKFTQHFGIK